MALAACLSGGACAAIAARHAGKMERLSNPDPRALVERARRAAEHAPPSSREEAALFELHELRDEAGRSLALATLLPRGMARIALASGTALAVLGLSTHARESPGPAVVSAFAAFLAGLFGSAASAHFGRRARGSADRARVAWKRALATAEIELGAVLGGEVGQNGAPADRAK